MALPGDALRGGSRDDDGRAGAHRAERFPAVAVAVAVAVATATATAAVITFLLLLPCIIKATATATATAITIAFVAVVLRALLLGNNHGIPRRVFGRLAAVKSPQEPVCERMRQKTGGAGHIIQTLKLMLLLAAFSRLGGFEGES